jgi:ribosomal-protein-alanine N-acetyltransferase
MDLSATCGIYRLAAHHLPDLQRHAASPRIAATTRLPHPYPADGAERFFRLAEERRAAGTGHVFALEDDGAFRGVVALRDVTGTEARVGFWIGEPFWGRGYATFALTWVLPYAFRNLRLAAVRAETLADHAAALRVLAKCGFHRDGERAHGDARWPAAVPLALHSITAAQWREHRDAPAVARLHPALRVLLAAELAAGNEVVESTLGWPDADSVFVRLRDPFRALPQQLPAGVAHHEGNDPHWWRADLSTRSPRHVLAY